MHQTKERNGVLLFFAPRSQSFAVIGDEAIHSRCGDSFWQTLTSSMEVQLRQGLFTDAICHAIRTCGELLSQEFPRRPADINELDDTIQIG